MTLNEKLKIPLGDMEYYLSIPEVNHLNGDKTRASGGDGGRQEVPDLVQAQPLFLDPGLVSEH